MDKGGMDPKSIIKMQDALDIISKFNRMRYNSYDEDFLNHINNMSNLDRAGSILEYLSKNGDKKSRENARYMINLLHNVDSIKNDVGYIRKNSKNYNDEVKSSGYKQNIASKNNFSNKGADVFNKIITFLKYLNGEE